MKIEVESEFKKEMKKEMIKRNKLNTKLFILLIIIVLISFFSPKIGNCTVSGRYPYEPEITVPSYTEDEIKEKILQCVIDKMQYANNDYALDLLIKYCEVKLINEFSE